VGLGVGVLEIAGLPEFDEGARAGGGGAFQFRVNRSLPCRGGDSGMSPPLQRP
jgi:hypothetical protein